jgi:hypothetical protein
MVHVFRLLAVLCLFGIAVNSAEAQSRSFSCDENGITGPIVQVTLQGPGQIKASPLQGRSVSLISAGGQGFHFINVKLGLEVKISQDQTKMTVRGPGETVHCSVYTGAVERNGGQVRAKCPPGTRPVAGSDGACAAARDDAAGGAPGPSFGGTWVQTSSSAGACPDCSITIRRLGSGWQVSASNGWSASVVEVDDQRLSGNGRWPRNAGTRLDGQPFTLELELTRRGLQMTMAVADGTSISARFAPE